MFPELALTGYFVGLQYHKAALRLDSDQIRKLAAATKGTAAVVGFIEESRPMNFYNSALIAVDGEILFANRKLNLPNYGAFEERKFFANGKHIRVFRLNDFNVSVFICNDMWHPRPCLTWALPRRPISLFPSSIHRKSPWAPSSATWRAGTSSTGSTPGCSASTTSAPTGWGLKTRKKPGIFLTMIILFEQAGDFSRPQHKP